MTSQAAESSHQEIRQFLQRMNESWLQGDPENLTEIFHQDVVIAQPGLTGRVKGQRTCVESYKDFKRMATVHEFKSSEPTMDVWGDTAVVSYPYEIAYEIGGESYHEFGHDLLVLVRESGHWQAVWRTIVPKSRACSD